jgi:hypothetical protein
MYDMGAATRDALNKSQTVEQRRQIIARVAGRCMRWLPTPIYDFYRTPCREYTQPGQSPMRTTYPTLISSARIMNFYPFNDIETSSPSPMLSITGDQA